MIDSEQLIKHLKDYQADPDSKDRQNSLCRLLYKIAELSWSMSTFRNSRDDCIQFAVIRAYQASRHVKIDDRGNILSCYIRICHRAFMRMLRDSKARNRDKLYSTSLEPWHNPISRSMSPVDRLIINEQINRLREHNPNLIEAMMMAEPNAHTGHTSISDAVKILKTTPQRMATQLAHARCILDGVDIPVNIATAKIPIADLQKVKQQYESGVMMKTIGEEYGCTPQIVRLFLKRNNSYRSSRTPAYYAFCGEPQDGKVPTYYAF